MRSTRRPFIAASLATAAALCSRIPLAAEPPVSTAAQSVKNPADRVRPTHDVALASEFVAAAHRDLEKVRAMLAKEPRLVFASVDTGNVGKGDWETGLNGASHVGRRDIVHVLLEGGARIDLFCAAMLGYSEMIRALLLAQPRAALVKGPHNLSLLYHAAIGGDVSIAEAIKPLIPAEAPDYNQALSAAARDGHVDMVKWLLQNGATNVNAMDAFRRTPLRIAIEKGFDDVAAELRARGGRESL